MSKGLRILTGLAALMVVLPMFHGAERPASAQVPLRSPTAPATVFAVGDIMHCAAPAGGELTGRLMERLLNETPNSIGLTLGDNSNDDGSEASYDCLNASTWGKLMGRLFPSPGNHDYGVDSDLPFYFLFFPQAGPPRLGYYAFDFGGWRMYSLNSELAIPELRHQQLDWLERDLRAHHRDKCVLAYFHRPPYSSGHFASPRAHPIFRKLYKYGADVVLTGHEHFFAAMPPMDPEGAVDPAYGIPFFISGTGGAVFFQRPRNLRYGAHGEDILSHTLGVLRLTLESNGYQWGFVPVHAGVRAPSGTGRCHQNPPGYVG
jgi:hypothetical protein